MRTRTLLLATTMLAAGLIATHHAFAQAPASAPAAAPSEDPKKPRRPGRPPAAPPPAAAPAQPPAPPASRRAQPPAPRALPPAPPVAAPAPPPPPRVNPPTPPVAAPSAPPLPRATPPVAKPSTLPTPQASPSAPQPRRDGRREERREDRREGRGDDRRRDQARPPVPTTPPPPAAQTPSAPPSPPTARTPSAPPSPPAAQVPATPPAPPASRIPGTPSAPPAAQSPATPPPAAQTPPAQGQPSARRDGPRRLEEVRGERHEERRGNQVIIREGDRTIIRQGDQVIIRRDEAERFRRAAPDARVERRGRDNVTTIVRPGGVQIVTVTDNTGRLIRRVRRDPRGREFVLIDNVYRGPRRAGPGFVIVLPPPVIRIPRERYIVDAGDVPPTVIYETLMAPPVERLDRRYTLDEIRYSPMVRDRMPRIDLDTITFETGSWEVTPDQAARLAPIADGIRRAIAQNPNEVFLVEGHTDAVGSDEDNLSLSDRRAESVALVLSEQFGVPPENLTAQGYGEQYLKVPSEGPERINRRVTVRRITPLLTGQSGPQ